MAMNKKDFIALADAIRNHNQSAPILETRKFDADQLETIAEFCRSQNPRFMRGRWLEYIAGNCGPNGGAR